MPIAQFVVTLDDLLNNANATANGTTVSPVTGASTSYNNVGTVLRQLNLPSGRYRVRVDGFNIDCGAINTTSYMINPQVINIDSTKFLFPGGGVSGLNFTNNFSSTMPDLKGHREFIIEATGGIIDLSICIKQFGQAVNANVAAVVAPYTIDKTATWTSANFAYYILTLDFELCNSQATFGTAKGAFI